MSESITVRIDFAASALQEYINSRVRAIKEEMVQITDDGNTITVGDYKAVFASNSREEQDWDITGPAVQGPTQYRDANCSTIIDVLANIMAVSEITADTLREQIPERPLYPGDHIEFRDALHSIHSVHF